MNLPSAAALPIEAGRGLTGAHHVKISSSATQVYVVVCG